MVSVDFSSNSFYVTKLYPSPKIKKKIWRDTSYFAIFKYEDNLTTFEWYITHFISFWKHRNFETCFKTHNKGVLDEVPAKKPKTSVKGAFLATLEVQLEHYLAVRQKAWWISKTKNNRKGWTCLWTWEILYGNVHKLRHASPNGIKSTVLIFSQRKKRSSFQVFDRFSSPINTS